jgi:LCP family protein required for cell wall assembly
VGLLPISMRSRLITTRHPNPFIQTGAPRRRTLLPAGEHGNRRAGRRLDFGATRGHTRAVRLIAGLGLVLALAATAAGGYWLAHLGRSIRFSNPDEASRIQAQLVASPEQTYNVLIAGVDATSTEQPYRTETLVFAYVNPSRRQVWMLWVPPDVLLPMKGHGRVSIADAHLYGGAAGTIQAFRTLTGLPVSQYAEVDFSAIEKTVDSVGGVWVDVPSSVEVTSAAATSAPDTGRLDSGAQLLDGRKALTLMRALPPLSEQPYQLMENQRLLVDAIAGTIGAKATSPSGLRILAAAAPSIRTSMSLSTIAGLTGALRDAGPSGIHSATVIGTWQSPHIVPDHAILTRLEGDMRAARAFDMPNAELAKAAQNSVAVSSRKKPSQVTVTVENGGGIAGAAKEAAGVLQTRGFRIASTGNANQSVYPRTLVVYKSDVGLANLVAQYLPPETKTVRSFTFYSFKTDVLVIVGRDWDIGRVPSAQIQTQ